MAALFLLALTADAANAQTPPSPNADDSEGYTFQSDLFIKVLPTRLSRITHTHRMKVLKEEATRSVGQQAFPVIESVETVELEASVVKADGKVVKVPPANILTQEINAGLAGIYQPDAKLKVVIFPNLQVGDTTVVVSKYVEKATAFEGNFTRVPFFYIPGTSGETNYTLEYPKNIGLKTVVSGDIVEVEQPKQTGNSERRKFFYRQPYLRQEPGSVSPLDWSPRVASSTFKSYEDFGRAYGKKAWPKVIVTPEIKTLAETITAGKTDPRQQAAAIDAWVKSNIRYVAIYRAFERIIPNDAETILRNRYGDCKDTVTLSLALLAAKNIRGEMALVNAGNSYALQNVPVVGEFNHVIVYIPGLDIYTDPTVATADFGILSSITYDKPVVRIASASEAVVGRTPVMKPEDHVHTYKLDMNIAADGKMSGTTEETATGSVAATMRSFTTALRQSGFETSATNRLTQLNNPGKGIYLPEDEKKLADPYIVRGTLSLFEPLTVPPRMTEPLREGMPFFAAAPYNYFSARWPNRTIDFVCSDGRDVMEINLTFAAGLPMPTVYKPVAVSNDFFRFSATFAIEERTFKIRRVFETIKKTQVCGKEKEPLLAADLQKVINASNIMLRFPGR